MQFILIDKILELNKGSDITAIKTLSIAEEYLKDHFPRFPVMPGVLMLEGLFQSSAWLVRESEDFAHSMIIMKEARNTKYAGFVSPGQTLTIRATILKQDETTTTLKARGSMTEGMLQKDEVAARDETEITRPPTVPSDSEFIQPK